MAHGLLAVVIALVITPAASCGSPAEPGRLDQTVSLHPGESASLSNGALRLQFDEVASDSRCPSDVQCIRAGDAEVRVTVTSAGRTESYSLFVGKTPTSVDHAEFTIELVRLDPYPRSSSPIPRGEYAATLRVTSRGA